MVLGRNWRGQLDSPSGSDCPCDQRSTRREGEGGEKEEEEKGETCGWEGWGGLGGGGVEGEGGGGRVSMAGAAASINFVATNTTDTCLSRQNTSFVSTKVCLSRQNYVLSRQTREMFCCDKHNFVTTNILWSRHDRRGGGGKNRRIKGRQEAKKKEEEK